MGIGGLGFRDFLLFNQALLAKQGWEILTQTSFTIHVFQIYLLFPTPLFYNVTTPLYPFFVQKGLLWGRQLLQMGIGWRVRNGESTSIMNSGKTNFKPFSPLTATNSPSIVADLITKQGEAWNWDHNIIQQNHFPTCSPSHLPDTLAWLLNNVGIVNVKRGY